jgi:sulfate permease, SulP family
VLVLVLVFLGWIEQIPEPTLAAIVIHAVSKSLRLSVFRNYFLWRRDRLVSVAAVVTVIFLGVLNGLLAAIALSIALLLRSLARPKVSILGRVGAHDFVSVERFPAATPVPGMLVIRPEEPLFFANAEPVLAQLRECVLADPSVKIVVLSLEESPDLDSTSLEVLGELCSWLAGRGVELRLARLKDSARDALTRSNLKHLPADELHYASVDDAVRRQRVTP